MTERSRGFGFITYESAESLNTAVSSAPHSIKGKEVTAKKAVGESGKVYVGKIPEDGPTEAVIRDQLSQFGTIAEVERPVDRSLGNKPKDFFFVTFEKESVAKKLLEAGTITVEGIEMMVKPVNNNKGQQHKSGRGGGRGRGGRGGQQGFNGGMGGYGGEMWGGYGGPGGYGGYGGPGGYGGRGGYGGPGGPGGYGGRGGYGGPGGYGGYGGGGKMMRGGRGRGSFQPY